MVYQKIDFEDIKRRFPLRATVSQWVKVVKRTPRYDVAFCPFHPDSQPSLVVYEDQMTCKAGCLINGGEFADVLDFVKEYFRLPSIKDAIRYLDGEVKKVEPILIPHDDKPERVLNWKDVERGLWHQKEAIPYFVGRGVKQATIQKNKMGLYVEWPNHVIIKGEDHVFHARRYTLPDIAFGAVRSIELRLDEVDSHQRLSRIDQALVEAAAEAYEIKAGKTPTSQNLIYLFFGGKYLRVPGGVKGNIIFNAERVMSKIVHNGRAGWFSPELDYVLVHEGRLKALAMEDCCDDPTYGYPSIAAKGANGLALLFGVKELIIVQDNDTDKVNRNGHVFNPGTEYARRTLEASLRTSRVRIIRPPDGYKAADDVVLGGDVQRWMDKEGLEPLKLR